MRIEIFDVTHGFCAYLVATNGNVMLFDCGYNEKTGFRPSQYLPAAGCTGIERLVIQNFDQDHVSDLPQLREQLPISALRRNPSIPADAIEKMKLEHGPLTAAMTSALEMHRNWVNPAANPPDFSPIEFQTFHNQHPAFTDTNNLSLVSFIHYGANGIIFTGDLERAGWESLLENKNFCENLARVNIFVAAHHGRTTGYHEAVFEICKPDVIIISDKPVVHGTQRQVYGEAQANGVYRKADQSTRYVFTTRSDGDITIELNLNGYDILTG